MNLQKQTNNRFHFVFHSSTLSDNSKNVQIHWAFPMSTAQNKQSHRLKILIVCKNNQNIPVQKQKRELTVQKNQKQIFKN